MRHRAVDLRVLTSEAVDSEVHDRSLRFSTASAATAQQLYLLFQRAVYLPV